MKKLTLIIVISSIVLLWHATARAAASGTWTSTGSMTIPRSRHTATLLSDGEVLVSGGLTTGNIPTRTAELYDPVTGTWSATGSLTIGRSRHTATLLSNGYVLVAGGIEDNGLATATAELYDPSSDAWVLTTSMSVPRYSHTATLLADGKVLVAGGVSLGDGNDNPVEKSAEIYDPNTGTWNPADHMEFARFGHAATLLNDGTVLVTGGAGPRLDGVYSKGAEIYSPSSNRWTKVDPMAAPRGFHEAALLPDGRVLVAGGLTLPANTRYVTSSAEIYDPQAGNWAPTGDMVIARSTGPFGSALLPDGTFLIVGGRSFTAELYSPNSSTWILTGSMSTSRTRHTVTLLDNGTALVAGGETSSGFLSSAEIYNP